MEWHCAQALEAIGDAIPDEIAISNGAVRRTWRDYEHRAARLAQALVSAGLKPDAKVAILGYNSNEFLEAQYAAYKARMVAVNVNYRYSEDELVYLLGYADAEAIFFDAEFGPLVAAARSRLPMLGLLIEIADGSGRHLEDAEAYEQMVASEAPLKRADYSLDDIYMLFTGGTTGMPKGVMYRHGDFAQKLLMGFGLSGQTPPTSLKELAAAALRNRAAGIAPTGLAACPLMHGVGLWTGIYLSQMMGGQGVTCRNRQFDSDTIWRLAERERASVVAIVGDAFARPMLAALRAAKAAERPYDLTNLKMIFSSGAMFSREVKEGLLEFVDVTLVDSMGASEGGIGSSVVSRSNPPGATATFPKGPETKVFDANDEEVAPGSPVIGLLASGARVPIGYYKDPVKSAAVFRTVSGRRYSFPGDFAKVAADGSLILLGRGSACINTGGEKVFPEEVEEVLKAHPDVEDAVVVGVPDERFGERVAAVVSACVGGSVAVADLIAFARTKLARYKAPREVVLVAAVQRAANGKADYKWAKAVALASIAGHDQSPHG